MGKFERGMMAGAKPFEEISKTNAEIIRQSTVEMKNDVSAIRNNINEIIDIIAEQDPFNRKEIIEHLKQEKNANAKPLQYKIQIVYEKEDKQLADNLRKSLNQNGNAASAQILSDYKTHNTIADYYIMLGETSESQRDSHREILLNANGCHIERQENHIYAFITAMNVCDDKDWESFIGYYKAEMTRATELNDYFANAVKAKRIKTKRVNAGNKVMDSVDDVCNKAMDSLEKGIDKLPEPLSFLFGLPLMIGGAIIGLFAIVTSLPIGLGIDIINSTIDSLDKKSENAIANAQKQILLLKTTEYIRNLQIQKMPGSTSEMNGKG